MFKMNNLERDALIYKEVEACKEEYDNDWTWQYISNCMSILGYKVSENACRKAYKRYCEKNFTSEERINKAFANTGVSIANAGIKYEGTNVTNYNPDNIIHEGLNIKLDRPKEKQFKSIEVKSDGTQISERRIMMSETDSKSPEFCLIAHGYDPKLWEVVSIKNNFWDSAFGEGEINTLFQSKLIAKPIAYDRELTKEDIIDLVRNVKPMPNNFKLIKQELGKEELALEIDFADLHVGSLSWHEEVGEDNDYKITFATVKRQVVEARKIIELYNVNKVYLCFLGDFLQCDNIEGSTTKGTPVDTDSRSKKMVNKGMEIAMYIIENLAIAETEVIWIEGNHSRLVEYTLFQSLPYIYCNAKHIKFDVSPRIRKAFVYGDNLIGLHHGEMKKDQMFGWLQVEHREAWGEAKYAEQHSGHTHQETVIEKGGIINRTNPTSKVQDAYEYENGWKSEKATIAYLWTKHNKLKGQFYLR